MSFGESKFVKDKFCFICLLIAGGYPVEAGHGCELWHMSLAQLPVHLCPDESCRHIWRNFLQVFWNDSSSVPGLLKITFIPKCHSVDVGRLIWFTPVFFLFIYKKKRKTELLQTVQRNCLCSGNCVGVQRQRFSAKPFLFQSVAFQYLLIVYI